MKLDRMPEVRVADAKVPSPATNAQKCVIGESCEVAERSTGAAPMAGIACPF
jgi:hypothetical protein